jgi:AraC-like DNA-binding protein
MAPPASLRRHLVCTWSQVVSSGAGDYPQRILPDGCVDIVWIGASPAIVAGPATRFVVASLPPGATIVGVRFRPGCGPPGLGVPASELRDRQATLDELWGRSAGQLSEEVAEHTTAPAKLAAIESALASRWAGIPPGDPLITAAVTWLAHHPGQPVHRLAHELGVSSRQLQRRFVAAVGYGPKTFQRIARFQRLLALGRAPGSPGRVPALLGQLGALALAAGYADQAHMTRDVRELAGRTPSMLLGHSASTLEMSELFKTTVERTP